MMKNIRYNNICLRALALLCLMMASVGAWAADYVLTYTNGGTTYYLARNGTTGVTRVNTFNPTTCIWSCETSTGGAGTLNNSNTYGYLYQTVNGTKYYLYADADAFSLKTGRATNNYSRMRTNGTYVYNRYSNSTSYYINLANNAPARNTTANTASNARPYQVTPNSVAVNNNGITAPTISCSGLSGSAGIQLSRTGVGGSYIPAHTTYAFNNQTIYYYNNTAYTNTNQFAVSVNANDATYNWSVTAGTANVSNAGVVTLGNNNTQNVTVRCRATINGVNKDATYTLNATATAALNETAYSDITITPSSQTLDLGEEVTYTVSPSISQVTKTRPQYVTVTDAQGHTHYKVGTTYQAAEPAITETPGAAINFTSFNWSAAEGGAYFTLDPYYSASSNKVTLTRSAQKTGTQQTFTISVTGVYGGQNKTASATVTIPATKVDLTALHAGEAINLGMGSSEGISSHYTYEPDYDAAGSPYLKFKYTSANTSVATVDESGKVTAVGPGSTTITVTAVKLDGTDGVTCNVTVNVTIDAPTISIDGSGNVTITHPVPGVQIRYTTDGTDPTATTGTVYSGTFAASNEQTIKAIAVANGVASAVASQFYATSGVSGTKVVINDYEDHNWTYYAGVDSEVDEGNYNTKYKGIMYSPNPRNVKITYNATNGAAVSIDEAETSFVYYKTLEEGTTADQYPYQVISSPFSKRPNGKGFAGWKIVSGYQYIRRANGQMAAENAVLNLDEEITFVGLPYPSVNCTSVEIEFETTWANATIKYGAANISSTDFRNGTYETNILVLNAASNATLAPSYPVTIMSVEPDGSRSYRGNAFTGNITPVAGGVTKIEWTPWNSTATVDARGRNLWIGRGVTNNTNGWNLRGNASSGTTMNHTFKIESGKGQTLHGYSTRPDAVNKLEIVLGNDYDRAKSDNSKLSITGYVCLASTTIRAAAAGKENASFLIKSGQFLNNTGNGSAGTSTYCMYLWYNSGNGSGSRSLTMEGGEVRHIAGGYDSGNNQTDLNLRIRIKGGIVRGVVFGGAAKNDTYGGKSIVVTGGTFHGWIAGASNGFEIANNGTVQGETFVYVGGNAVVGTNESVKTNASMGGNVYGAGCGLNATSTSGRATRGTNTVLADNAHIRGGVYGGGAFGYCPSGQTANVYVTGGIVDSKYDDGVFGGVYGGARQNQGGEVKMYMTGGLIKSYVNSGVTGGGLYGGSNAQGTINGSVTMQINGGQVGEDATHLANIHGGGYGSDTRVLGSVNMTLGKDGASRDADGVTVYGDVYGGSAQGKTNGNNARNGSAVTNVTMNASYIHGSLYGGGLGTADYAADVYGPVQVKVYGGSVMKTDANGANGSGAVYGANNVKGAPQMSATVDIYGTNSAPAEGEYALFSVYGGGNAADYTYGNGYPKVTVHNCDNSIEYVYGGGNAAAVAATDVTIYGGNKIGNVFGGGNGQVRAANVNGNTNVKIYGGTIGDVYGGSNTNGTIGGTISVNVNEQAEGGSAACPVNIDNVYGGGNQAASNAGSITIGCAEHIGTVYGGANQANITGDITLNINSGHIDNVFGGNNTSGAISGNITVNVNDNGSACGMEVGNVYGGGNQAAYGHNTDYPQVNILNGTITGSVFGGGLGSTAIVTGNPKVNINAAAGKTISVGGSVFGGGSLAPIAGNTDVKIIGNSTVQGNVYGGGNQAEVSGTTKVQVGECD